MNLEQMNAAKQSLTEWLSHPQELGKAPAKIECAGTFELHEMHYYIFKYKKNLLGKWLLGVCGGYEGDELEHCGHVFSEMEEYDESTAREKAAAMVEMVREYWMEQAKKAEERKQNPGTFVSFVLLEEANWDKEALLRELKEGWQIENEPGADDAEQAENDETFIVGYHGALIAVSLMPGPIPDGEAERCAGKSYLWKNDIGQVRRHQAHLLVAVMGRELAPAEAGELLVKTVASCCKQDGVLGVYANGTVYPPDYYLHFSGMVKENLFPIYNLVWFGLYRSEKGVCGYTCGMRQLGYDEMEIIDSSADPESVLDFLSDIANYVVTEAVVLNDGETIGFSAEQTLSIVKSKGIAVEGESLKIEFPG